MGEAEEVVETEEQAKAQGWAPKDEWKGDPDKWVDAKTFVDKGEKIAAIKKERTDHMTNEIRELRSLIVEQKDMAKKARLQGYQQALQEIESRQFEAVENVDTDAFKKAKEDEKKILKQIDEESKETPAQDAYEAEMLRVFDEWKEENPWYTKAEKEDIDLYVFTQSISTVIQNETGYGGKKLYDEVTKRVKKAFPHKFGNPRRNDAGSVESGTEVTLKKKSGRTFDDLPADAKKTYERLAKQFKMAKQEFTKEEYLSNYVWE
jgi:hypothetical protein